MAVLTNKPVVMSRAIVEALGLGAHFHRVYGGNSFEQKKPHPGGIETLLAEGESTRERTMMVGDSGGGNPPAPHAPGEGGGGPHRFSPGAAVAGPAGFAVGPSGRTRRLGNRGLTIQPQASARGLSAQSPR